MNRKALKLKALNRKTVMIVIISVIAVALISGIIIAVVSHVKHSDAKTTSSDNGDLTYVSPALEEDEETEAEIRKEIAAFVPATKMDLDPNSVTVYVNKEFALPKDYRPDNLVTPNVRFAVTYYDERTLMRPEASKALEKLFTAAEKSGYYLTGVSAFRSYNRQFDIFTNNLATKGKEHTLLYSAVPGTSEHQTGLAIDLASESFGNRLDEGFADTPEGKWLAKYSYRFGFIIRYPKDMAEVTGYAYEPWHIRYVGRPLAYYLYKNNLTLDEYYKYKPSPDFDFEKKYADILSYVAPTVTVTMTPTPSATPSVTPKPKKDKGNKGKGDKTDEGKTNDNTGILSVTPVPTPAADPGAIISGAPQEGNTGSSGGEGNGTVNDGSSSDINGSNESELLN